MTRILATIRIWHGVFTWPQRVWILCVVVSGMLHLWRGLR